MASALEVEARLVLTWPGGHEIQLAGAGAYLILNVPSQQVLDLTLEQVQRLDEASA